MTSTATGPGKTITEYDDHLFCLLTMNHHPLHINEWFAENETVQHKNVVVGNLVYSLVLGMSVPDVSGSCIANLEVESLVHRYSDLSRGHHLRRNPRPRQSGLLVQARPRHRHRRDPRASTNVARRSVTSAASSWCGCATPLRLAGVPMGTTSGSERVPRF